MRSIQHFLLVTLGLSTITLVAFSIIWGSNGAAADDWVYYYYAANHTITILGSNREFGILLPTLGYTLFPGFQLVMYLGQILSVAGAGVVLYYIFSYFAPRFREFGLLLAIIFILYIPGNPHQAMTYYSGSVFTWITFVGLAAIWLFLVQHTSNNRRKWPLLLGSAIAAYVAIRGQEASLFPLLFAPGILVLRERRLTRALLAELAVWYTGVGIATIQVLSWITADKASDVVYQQWYDSAKTAGIIFDRMLKLLTKSVPAFPATLDALVGSLTLGVLLAIIAGCFWLYFCRRNDSAVSLPPVSHLLVMLLLGAAFMLFGFMAPAYVGLLDYGRSHYFAAPGQALIVVSCIGLLGHALNHALGIRIQATLITSVILFSLLGMSWYTTAQNTVHDRRFDKSLQFFHDFFALVPRVEDHSLIVFDCSDDAFYYEWVRIDDLAVRYFYNPTIHASPMKYVEWTPDKVIYAYPILFLEPEPIEYLYDEVVLVQCTDNYLYIAPTIPQSIMPDTVSGYNPFARISQDFFTEGQWHLLGF